MEPEQFDLLYEIQLFIGHHPEKNSGLFNTNLLKRIQTFLK